VSQDTDDSTTYRLGYFLCHLIPSNGVGRIVNRNIFFYRLKHIMPWKGKGFLHSAEARQDLVMLRSWVGGIGRLGPSTIQEQFRQRRLHFQGKAAQDKVGQHEHEWL
jgi:hypothetical protein